MGWIPQRTWSAGDRTRRNPRGEFRAHPSNPVTTTRRIGPPAGSALNQPVGAVVGRRPEVDILGETPPVQQAPRNWVATPLHAATVLVADPFPATRVSLSAGLEQAGIGRVVQAGSAAAVRDVIDGRTPRELALISVAFGADLHPLVNSLRWAGWPRVIALARAADSGSMIDACRAGASGVLGGPTDGAVDDKPRAIPALTDREVEVLEWVADGRSNQWIAEQLTLPSRTVKAHLSRIGRKLGTGDRAEMVAIAMRAGVIR